MHEFQLIFYTVALIVSSASAGVFIATLALNRKLVQLHSLRTRLRYLKDKWDYKDRNKENVAYINQIVDDLTEALREE